MSNIADLSCPAPPHLVSLALRWHLLTNPAVMFGSFFFGLGIVFTMALGTNTGLVSTLWLALDRKEAPGWLHSLNETHYEEQDERVYRYEYTFRLPDGTLHNGTSYWPGKVQQPVAAAAGVARPPDATIDYSPSLPQVNRLKGTRTGLCAMWVLFVVLFPTIGLLATWGGLRHGRGRIRLLENGQFAWATFTSARIWDYEDTEFDPSLTEKGTRDEPATWNGGPAGNEPAPRSEGDQAGVTLAGRALAEDDHQQARRMAWRFWLMGLLGIALMVGLNVWGAGAGPQADLGQVFFGLALAAMTLFALLVYFARSRFAELVRRRARLAREGGSVEEFPEISGDGTGGLRSSGPAPAAPRDGNHDLRGALFAAWVGSVFAMMAWFITFMIQRLRGVPLGGNFPQPEHVAAILAFVVSVAVCFRLLIHWARRRETAQAAGLVPARETGVECTYQFPVPDGRVIEGKDLFRLPMGPEEAIPHLVLYHPSNPQEHVRLFAVSPAVRLSPQGTWQADVSAGLAMARLAFVLICYTAGPVLGWLARAGVGA